MSDLKATHPLSLQFLINEDIYAIDTIPPVDHAAVPALSADLPAPAAEAHDFTSAGFDYLGENNRYMLLLVNDPANKVMPQKELEALQSILGAKKMELKDVAIVNLHHYPSAGIEQLKTFFACTSIVLFGINPQLIKIPASGFNEIGNFEGIKLLSTFGFPEMMGDVEKKKAFWNEMKKL